jgi:CHAT domain-containing protein
MLEMQTRVYKNMQKKLWFMDPTQPPEFPVERVAMRQTHPDYATCLRSLAGLRLVTGRLGEAASFSLQALELRRNHMDETFNAQSERQQLLLIQRERAELDFYLTTALGTKTSDARAYSEVLQWKGAVHRRQAWQGWQRDQPELAAQFNELDRLRAQLARVRLRFPQGTNEIKWQNWREQVRGLEERKERLEVTLAEHSRGYARSKQVEQGGTEAVRQVLPTNTVLMDYLEFSLSTTNRDDKGKFKSEKHLCVFVVSRNRDVQWLDLGKAERIEAGVLAWRKAVYEGDYVAEREQGTALRSLLWDPVAGQCAGVDTVLICADGALGMLPFGALPGSHGTNYLVEEVATALIPTAFSLVELNEEPRKSAPEGMLLVGDVDYGAAPGTNSTLVAANRIAAQERGQDWRVFAPLDNTRGEVLAVGDSYRRHVAGRARKLLRASEATEGAVRETADKYRWMHLATHGYFAPVELKKGFRQSRSGEGLWEASEELSEAGVLSGLALAGANRLDLQEDEDDGILTAEEVAGLDLRGVEMVVLSACETALGRRVGGEGMLGLQRAFQVSGARTVVASLWNVNDQATRRMMEQFYEQVWQGGVSKLAALRQAQLRMLESEPRREVSRGVALASELSAPRRTRISPYYWAPFVLSGDWR